MDSAEFDRLIARARNPRLIAGIYNYCDGRCARCPLTDRCLVFLDGQATQSTAVDTANAEPLEASLDRAIEMLTEIARREGIDLAAVNAIGGRGAPDLERLERDSLLERAREYADLAWSVGRTLEPLVAARGDAAAIAAVESILWFSSHIHVKLARAVWGHAVRWELGDDVQADFNGSAKVALAGIGESRDSWLTLARPGRALADGVPERAVRMLDAIESIVRERFPRAHAFVRPGFDAAAGADGGRVVVLPWRRPRRDD
jgi:hypothetical protein